MDLHYPPRLQEDHNHLTQTARPIGQHQDLGQVKLIKGSSVGASPSTNRRSNTSTPLISTTTAPTMLPNIRKYLVLLHDSLAIKFVPCCSIARSQSSIRAGMGPEPHGYHAAQNAQAKRTSLVRKLSLNHEQRAPRYRNEQPNFASNESEAGNFCGNGGKTSSQSNISNRKWPPSSPYSALDFHPELTANGSGMDLYKSFCNTNLQCYWNAPLYDAIQNLEYKGYIVPFTVLVSALPRFLTTLRVAWSRQMLRSPPGYRIEFVGEVEELLADPIQQSQFAPLSDSLCWAILEVTSSGQEAFVDAILVALNAYFPTMIMPNRELVFQTLEKLIREERIYQTSNGYFVVTPDTLEYMTSTTPLPFQSAASPNLNMGTASNTAETISKEANPQPFNESDKVSRNSWDSTASAANDLGDKGRDPDDQCQALPLRRHNSLRVIRQRDKEAGNTSKSLKGRSFSFRMYKSQSTPIRSEGNDSVSPANEQANQESGKNESSNKKSKSGTTSFFKKLFKRSSSKKSASDVAAFTDDKPSDSLNTTSAKNAFSCVATQTLPVNAMQKADTVNQVNQTEDPNLQRSSPLRVDDVPINSLRPAVTLQIENHSSTENLDDSRWNSLTRPRRSLSRLSLNSPAATEDNGHLYASPREVYSREGGVRCPEGHYPSSRGEFSRCSTISHGSLGYGSQGPASSLLGGGHSEGRSPTPSMTPSNFLGYSNSGRRSFVGPPPAYSHLRKPMHFGNYNTSYDSYRRRYPAYASYAHHPKCELRNGSVEASKDEAMSPRTWNRPASKVHDYETIRFSNKSQPAGERQAPMPEVITNPKKNETYMRSNFPSPRVNKRKDNEPFVSTTTVTQKSTTNMEVELRLPLGKAFPRVSGDIGGNNGRSVIINGNDTKGNVNVTTSKDESSGSSTTTIHIEQPSSETKVKTTISAANRNSMV